MTPSKITECNELEKLIEEKTGHKVKVLFGKVDGRDDDYFYVKRKVGAVMKLGTSLKKAVFFVQASNKNVLVF